MGLKTTKQNYQTEGEKIQKKIDELTMLLEDKGFKIEITSINQPAQTLDRQLETANKAGYVQGVQVWQDAKVAFLPRSAQRAEALITTFNHRQMAASVFHLEEVSSHETSIFFFRDMEHYLSETSKNRTGEQSYTIGKDINVAKEIVENTVNYISFHESMGLNVPNVLTRVIGEHYDTHPLDRRIDATRKAGYVQGVCESVLAFNTDENRKIMSESAITMLSKKLLSEMKVTQNMALIYANPKTYQALEQSIFAPKQEQKHVQAHRFK